ncbi:Uncharacterized protein APZ42_032895 [Daphnia magna]|uniref:Uncharacterized protein n=1 Tax=Daphnia magna TaxID=35525 RepID=A0A164LY69_9CRUS|nr:Uncharacterized protein APZ42_032895 [Daphnia magna]
MRLENEFFVTFSAVPPFASDDTSGSGIPLCTTTRIPTVLIMVSHETLVSTLIGR